MYSPEIALLIVNTYKYHVRRLHSKLLVFNCNGNVKLECLMLIIPRVHNKRREREYLTSMILPDALRKVMT